MAGLTMTDCSIADNRVQARYELDRALGVASGNPSYPAAYQWAAKWGRELLDAGYELPLEDDGIADLEEEIAEAKQEMTEMRDAIKTAIAQLESI